MGIIVNYDIKRLRICGKIMFRILNKFRKLLNKQQKLRVFIIGFMMVIEAFLETLGVGLILPLVTAITTPNIIKDNKYAKMVCEVLDIHTSRSFIVIVIIALIFVYIVKNLYLFIEYYVQNRFICNNRFAIQRSLMQAYLNRPYEFFLDAESGEIVRVVTSDTSGTFNLLSTVLSFWTEAVVSVALIITIIVTDPIMAFLVAAVLGTIMLLIGWLIKPVLRRAGLKNQKNAGMTNKWLLQSISGIKEVKIAQREAFFLNQFSKYGKRAIDSEKKNNVLGTIPRLAIEAFGISAMLAVIAILMWNGRKIETLLPQLSAFAVAAVRLLPSVNRMSTALNSMFYLEPALDKMLEQLSVTEQWRNDGESSCKYETAEMSLRDKIELSNITYKYPSSNKYVLKEASMEIPIGQSVGVVGTSGSGKTTAIDILLGLLVPESGEVLVDGNNIQNNYEGWLAHLGYIPQMIFMLDDSIRGNVAFGIESNRVDDHMVWKALEDAQLADYVHTLPDGLDTQIGECGIRLSGGQRQRIGIARALYTNPELLIFDEATSALDNETESAIMESIDALHGKKTILIIAHRLTTIEGCDMVYRVEKGKIKRER